MKPVNNILTPKMKYLSLKLNTIKFWTAKSKRLLCLPMLKLQSTPQHRKEKFTTRSANIAATQIWSHHYCQRTLTFLGWVNSQYNKPFHTKYMRQNELYDCWGCEMPLSFEKKNVRGKLGKCQHLKAFAKKKCIFLLLKVSFEAPSRFYFNFFYDLWLAGKKKKSPVRCPINAARPHKDYETKKTKSLPVRRKDHLHILWIFLLLWLISIWCWSYVKDLY